MRGTPASGVTRGTTLALLALLCAVAAAIGGCAQPAGPSPVPASSSPAAAALCEPTSPNGDAPPGEKPSPRFYGNGRIWTVLPPRGTVVFAPGGAGQIRADGSLAMKFPFWRGPGVTGDLTITGRGLDGADGQIKGEVPKGYGAEGFQASTVVFQGPGCWEVTARVGDASLTFVTRVVQRL